MLTTPAPVAFEVDFKTNPAATTPKRVEKHFQEVEQTLSKKSLSIEDLTAKLDSAVERKKALEDQKLNRNKEHWEKVLSIAHHQKAGENAELLENIQQKLERASEKKNEFENDKVRRIEQHLKEVSSRKEAASSSLSPGCADIQDKLVTAEKRRKTIEEERIERIAQHLKKVGRAREDRDTDTNTQSQILTSKLNAAEERRAHYFDEMQDKLKAHDLHAAEVRKRKLTNPKSYSAEEQQAEMAQYTAQLAAQSR